MRGWFGRLMFKLHLPVIRRALNGSCRVRVIVLDDGQDSVVLVKNLLSRQKWTLPGGGVDKGESSEQAAQRELEEELGLKLSVESLKFAEAFDHFEPETKASWQAVIFRCSIPEDTKLNHRRSELLKHAWFPLDELPANMTEIAVRALSSHGLGAKG